jgi:AcrR family transcriptional regulator
MPRDGLQTRQRILTSAYREFRRRGFTRVGMDEVAAAANVTKRTLYFQEQGRAVRGDVRRAAQVGNDGL